MYCENCGRPVVQDARFCEACGHDLAPGTEELDLGDQPLERWEIEHPGPVSMKTRWQTALTILGLATVLIATPATLTVMLSTDPAAPIAAASQPGLPQPVIDPIATDDRSDNHADDSSPEWSGGSVPGISAANAKGATFEDVFRTPDDAVYCRVVSNRARVWTRFLCLTPNDGFFVRIDGLSTGHLRVTKGYRHAFEGYRNSSAHLLNFGRHWSSSDAEVVTCASRRNGLTCRHAGGFGWWLGRLVGYRILNPESGGAASPQQSGSPTPPSVSPPQPASEPEPQEPKAVALNMSKAEQRALREAFVAAHPEFAPAQVEEPVEGSVFYARYKSVEWAVAWLPTPDAAGIQGRGAIFRRDGSEWAYVGQNGGEVCPSTVPLRVIRVWNLVHRGGTCYSLPY